MDEMFDYVDYLDNLRRSGRTNMFGAAPFLAQEFGLDRKEARAILAEWMGLDLDTPTPERAAQIRAALTKGNSD